MVNKNGMAKNCSLNTYVRVEDGNHHALPFKCFGMTNDISVATKTWSLALCYIKWLTQWFQMRWSPSLTSHRRTLPFKIDELWEYLVWHKHRTITELEAKEKRIRNDNNFDKNGLWHTNKPQFRLMTVPTSQCLP